MSDIKITGDTVEMTVTYKAKFTNEVEMVDAVKGAAELRGMVENCDNDKLEGINQDHHE